MNPFSTLFTIDLLTKSGQLDYVKTPNFTGSVDDNYNVYLKIQEYVMRERGSLLNDTEKASFDDIEQMLVSCEFNGHDCSARDFDNFFHPYYLNCYRFNANGARTVNIAGETSHLQLELYAGLPNSISADFYYRGFNVFIKNASQYPLNQIQSVIQVTPDLGTKLVVERFFYDQYTKPYSECTVIEEKLTSTLSDRTLFEQVADVGNYEYTQDTCINFCLQRMYANACKCYSAAIDHHIDGYTICLNDTQLKCLLDFYAKFTNGKYISDTCVPLCPIECSSSEIKVQNV